MNKERVEMLKSSIADIMRQMESVQYEIACGIIDSATAEEKVKILKQEERKKKQLLVAEAHVGKRGNALSMGAYNEKKKLFMVRCADGNYVSSTTEDGLLDALMEHYGLSLNSPLIGDIFARAIEKYGKKHPGKTKTVYNNKLEYKAFVNEQFAKTDIRKLNKDNLEEYLLTLIQEKKMKSKALQNCKGVLNLIFQETIDEGLIHKNIAKEVSNKYLLQYRDQSLSHRKSEDMLYSDPELEQIFAEAWNKASRYYSPYSYALLLQAELGCRPNELICLKWSDFDRIEGFVTIERQMVEDRIPKQSFRVVDYTKNEKGISQGGRLVPLSTKALDILNKLDRKKQELGIESEWLFTDKQGKPLKKKGYFDFVGDLYRKLGLSPKGSYAFRRGFSARLEAAGIEPSERAEILGHSVETNLRHYTFAKPDYLKRVKEALR